MGSGTSVEAAVPRGAGSAEERERERVAKIMRDCAEQQVDLELRRFRSLEAAAAAFRARGHPDDPDDVLDLEDFIRDIYTAWRPQQLPKLGALLKRGPQLPGGLGELAARAIERIVMRERPDVAMGGGG